MLNPLNQVTAQFQTANSLEQVRHRFTQVLLIVTLILAISGFIAQVASAAAGGSTDDLGVGTVLVAVLAFFSILGLFLLNTDRREVIGIIIVVTYVAAFFVIDQPEVSFLMATLTLITSAVLLETRWYLATNAIIFIKVLFDLRGIVAEFGMSPTPEGVSLTILGSALVVISVVTRYFISTSEMTASRSQRSSELLSLTAEIGGIVSRQLELTDIYERVVTQIRDRFGYYHVQVFMVDENRETAQLVASTGEAGRQLINRGHSLPVGSRSVIGRVAQSGEVVIARDGDNSGVHARNELLPDTRAELALPIMDGDRIIGALDVQSVSRSAFDDVDIQALRVMADQIGTAVRNVRLFQAQAASVQENKRLFFESETNLREIQRLNRQLTRKSWQDFLSGRQTVSGVMLTGTDRFTSAEWSARMIEAGVQQRPVVDARGLMRQIAVPIVLRGEVIGAIEVEASSITRDEDAVEMLQVVAQRLAISLDNARLFEEAQETSAQEQHINEIVGRYQSAATVDELLQITLSELNDTLGAQQGMIRLGGLNQNAAPTQNPPSSANGSSNGYHQDGEQDS